MKQTYFIYTLTVLFVIAGVYFAFNKDKGVAPNVSDDYEKSVELSKDSDGDGLKDWEEVLFGFDPRHPDTDKDGIDDYTEYQKMQEISGATSTTEESSSTTDNVTDTIAHKIFATYIYSKRNGAFDKELFKNVVAKIGDETITSKIDIPKDKYTKDDFKKIINPSVRSAMVYRASLKKALIETQNIKEYELTTYARFIEGDKNALDTLKKEAKIYQEASEKMLLVPTPEDILDTHIKLANAFYGLSQAMYELDDPEKDPILMQAVLRKFLFFEKQIEILSKRLQIYFKSKYSIIE